MPESSKPTWTAKNRDAFKYSATLALTIAAAHALQHGDSSQEVVVMKSSTTTEGSTQVTYTIHPNFLPEYQSLIRTTVGLGPKVAFPAFLNEINFKQVSTLPKKPRNIDAKKKPKKKPKIKVMSPYEHLNFVLNDFTYPIEFENGLKWPIGWQRTHVPEQYRATKFTHLDYTKNDGLKTIPMKIIYIDDVLALIAIFEKGVWRAQNIAKTNEALTLLSQHGFPTKNNDWEFLDCIDTTPLAVTPSKTELEGTESSDQEDEDEKESFGVFAPKPSSFPHDEDEDYGTEEEDN
jgi:HrpA-like RNA helicase